MKFSQRLRHIWGSGQSLSFRFGAWTVAIVVAGLTSGFITFPGKKSAGTISQSEIDELNKLVKEKSISDKAEK